MTTPEQFAAANALFLEIQQEFGKQPKKKPSQALRGVKPAATPKEDEQTTFLKESNKLAMLMESPTWKPIAIANHIVTQNCQQCGNHTEYVGGTLIRHQHKRSGDIWEYPRPYDDSFNKLPQIIEEIELLVPACVDCLRKGHWAQLQKEHIKEKQIENAREVAAELQATDTSPEDATDFPD